MTRVVIVRQGLPVPRDPRVWREAIALREAGYEVLVVAPLFAGQSAREVLDGVTVYRYRVPRDTVRFAGRMVEAATALLGAGRCLRRIQKEGAVGVLHALNPPDLFFLLRFLLPGARFVYDQADPVPELAQTLGGILGRLVPLFRFLERRSLRAADLVLVTNATCRALVIRRAGLDPRRALVIRIGPTEFHAASASADQRPLVIVFAGVVGPQDGVELLLVALSILLSRQPGSCRLEVIGDGTDLPRLRELARQLGVDGEVDWKGWLEGDDFREHLARADICVSADHDTVFNRLLTMVKLTDYLAAGAATVATDLPESRVTCGDAAVYFPPGDAGALALLLEKLVQDAQLRADLRRRAEERAPRLLWSHSAVRLQAAYSWLLKAGPPVPGDQPV